MTTIITHASLSPCSATGPSVEAPRACRIDIPAALALRIQTLADLAAQHHIEIQFTATFSLQFFASRSFSISAWSPNTIPAEPWPWEVYRGALPLCPSVGHLVGVRSDSFSVRACGLPTGAEYRSADIPFSDLVQSVAQNENLTRAKPSQVTATMLNQYLQYVRLGVPHAEHCETVRCAAPDIQCDCGAQRRVEDLAEILREASDLMDGEVLQNISYRLSSFNRYADRSTLSLMCLEYLVADPSADIRCRLPEFLAIARTDPSILFRATYALVRQREYLKDEVPPPC